MTRHSYCPACDAWMKGRSDPSCPTCGGAVESRTFRYPEDVFGPPAEDDVERSAGRRSLPDRDRGSVGAGVLYLMFGHGALLLVSMMGGAIGAIFFVGIFQVVYALPMMIIFGTMGKSETVSGIALAGGGTFLLNAAFFGVVCGAF